MKQKPVCRICGKPVVNGNLYCSHACGDGRVSHSASAHMLVAKGFVRDEGVANCFIKDGVAVTLEHVAHVGLEEALKQHQHVVAQREAHQ